MGQLVAMVTMVLDHWANGQSNWMNICGNMSMSIYTYGQACECKRGRADRLLLLAILAEIPYWLYFGRAGNIIWLFWICQCLKIDDQWEGREIELLLVWIVGAMLLREKLLWAIWIPLVVNRKREIWYGVQGGMVALTGNVEWAVHLVGYEVARKWGGQRVVPRIVWRSFYPAHLLVLAAMKSMGLDG